MTGFLSVLSLLPVQRLQQGEEEEEKEQQEEEEGRKEKRSGKRRGRGRREKASSGVTSPEPKDASSPDVNAERYSIILLSI